MKQEQKEAQEALKAVDKILGIIVINNNNNKERTALLRRLLFNLKIIGAKIPKTAGIDPIASALEKIVIEMGDEINKMLTEHRKEMADNMKTVREYILTERE